MADNFEERRSEPRRIIDQYYSVEFLIEDLEFAYQFKIWDKSSKGISVLVKEDSDLLNHIKVGDILNMKYYKADSSKATEYLKTEIKHITKDKKGRFKGLYLVGLSILEEQDSEKEETIEFVCPTCNTIYNISTNEIPQGGRFVGTCKVCNGKIVIEPSATEKDRS
jgi:uncharacterized protein YbaR (Trm112 family)